MTYLCNAGLHFGSDAQKLTCEYCGNTFDLDTVRAFNESQNSQDDEEFQWEPEQTESFSEDEDLSPGKLLRYLFQLLGILIASSHKVSGCIQTIADMQYFNKNTLI